MYTHMRNLPIQLRVVKDHHTKNCRQFLTSVAINQAANAGKMTFFGRSRFHRNEILISDGPVATEKAFLRFEIQALKAILVIDKLSEYGHFHDILSNVLFLNELIGMD